MLLFHYVLLAVLLQQSLFVSNAVVVEIIEKEIKVNKRYFHWKKQKEFFSFHSGPTTVQVPQPIFVHTGPSGYQTQYHSQQAPQSWSPVVIQSPESRPMLPQPSAPPRPYDNFHIEHPPPPYEKLYTGKQ